MSDQQQVDHKLYKISSVMELFDVSRAKIYRLVDRGELELVKIGAATRITAASVEHIIEIGKKTLVGSYQIPFICFFKTTDSLLFAPHSRRAHNGALLSIQGVSW